MTWELKIKSLLYISRGLICLHEKGLMHHDFHPGNLLYNANFLNITDLGLCKSTNQSSQSRGVYGVMPYVAPEVLYGEKYTIASDIYSFGIIAYELLAIEICKGLRPKIPSYIPEFITKLIMQCWNAQPEKRPTAKELFLNYHNKFHPEYIDQIEKAEKITNNILASNAKTSLDYKLHPGAIYTNSELINLEIPE
ncbi:15205_t:CDS:2, partial [Racocetra fulgida]